MTDFSPLDPGSSHAFPRMTSVYSPSHITPRVRQRLSSKNSNTSRQSYAEWVQLCTYVSFQAVLMLYFYILKVRKPPSPRSMRQSHEDIVFSNKPNHQHGCTHQASPQALLVLYPPLRRSVDIHSSVSLRWARNLWARNVSLMSSGGGLGSGCVGCIEVGCGVGWYLYLL